LTAADFIVVAGVAVGLAAALATGFRTSRWAGFGAEAVLGAFVADGRAGAAGVAVAARAFARLAVRAAAAAFVAVAARVVAARAVAVPAVAAFRVAAFADAAVAVAAFAATLVAAFVVAVRAAFALAASEPAPAVAAAFAVAVRRARAVVAGGSTVLASTVAPRRCAFPGRGVEACGAVPSTGTDPSTRGRSWWRELIHLTSVGGHGNALPGRGRGAHVNTP
jgi:hypothetical protein